MTALTIIGCGAGKRAGRSPAGDMYTGAYFRCCLATATAIGNETYILSARYGLLGLADEIEPYDLTIGQAGAVTADQLAEQATSRGLLGRPVLALCSARYAALLGQVWSEVSTPLAGLGIGQQRHVLAVMRQLAG